MPVLIVILILGLMGMAYSFWILFAAVLFMAAYYIRWKPNEELSDAGSDIIDRVRLYEEGRGPLPPPNELRIAANYLAFAEFSDYRAGDDQIGIGGTRGLNYPQILNEYLPTAAQVKRRYRNWRGFSFSDNMRGAKEEARALLESGHDVESIAMHMSTHRRVHPDDIKEVINDIVRVRGLINKFSG